MAIGVLAGGMTPEFGDALIVIDGVAITLFIVMIYSAQIAAGSSRLFRLLNASFLASQFRLWRAALKNN